LLPFWKRIARFILPFRKKIIDDMVSLWQRMIMKISDWIEKKKLSRTDAAELFGISEGQLSRLITGSRTPSSALAVKIAGVTKNKVTLSDFFEAA